MGESESDYFFGTCIFECFRASIESPTRSSDIIYEKYDFVFYHIVIFTYKYVCDICKSHRFFLDVGLVVFCFLSCNEIIVGIDSQM